MGEQNGIIASARLHARAVIARAPSRGEEGQAVIEFALTLVFAFGLLFFFIQLALILSWGNFVQYATFMSARAYLSGGQGIDDQKERARRVLAQTVKLGEGRENEDRLPMIAQGFGADNGMSIGHGPGYEAKNYSLSWLDGVRYTFRSRLFLLPLGKEQKGAKSDAGFLTLTSESWLGREATYGECMRYMQDKKGQIDNGC